jgi:hypothetical protein
MGLKMRLTEGLDTKVVIEADMLEFTTLLTNVKGKTMIEVDVYYFLHLMHTGAEKAKAELDYLADHVEYAPGFQPQMENVRPENQLKFNF